MYDVEAANRVTTVLTLLANAALAALVVAGIGAAVGSRGRRLASQVVGWVGPRAHLLALLVATVATFGSLYYSEVLGFTPCQLCWDQRVCMFPLVALLAVGVTRRDRGVVWYASPLVVIGGGIAFNHWIIERGSASARLPGAASSGAFCDVPPFEQLGYVTLAFMSLSAFLLIASLLVVAALHDHTARSGSAVLD